MRARAVITGNEPSSGVFMVSEISIPATGVVSLIRDSPEIKRGDVPVVVGMTPPGNDERSRCADCV
jgi:hypothetical protein